ncbi:MAG: glycine cleavage system protein GcvH [Candidatus Caldatribacteriota bacterium]|jgi:glycine cleavage system H protein|nr:glycine cleavage system protein GcvH [Atribacterota bacterium]MDD3031392.1 glycine cleavage system protein GcvH [Atribacterota bacterium]
MSKIIENLFYSKNDEWLKDEGNNIVVIGITDYAQSQLGDIVYVEEIKNEIKINKGDVLSTVESVKAVSDVYSPVSGEVVEVNQKLVDEPATVNHDPYGEGWFVKIKMINPEEIKELMTSSEYNDFRKE